MSSFINAGHSFRLNAHGGQSFRIDTWKSTITFGQDMTWQRTPMFYGGILSMSDRYDGNMGVTYNGTPSKLFSYYLSDDLNYGENRSAGGDLQSRMLSNRFVTSSSVHFLKHCFVSVNYSLNTFRNLGGLGSNENVNDLAASIGCRIMQGRLTIGLSAGNILDSRPSYLCETTPVYVYQHWNTYYGRNVMLNIIFKFNKTSPEAIVGIR